jgi:hypothetical protein
MPEKNGFEGEREEEEEVKCRTTSQSRSDERNKIKPERLADKVNSEMNANKRQLLTVNWTKRVAAVVRRIESNGKDCEVARRMLVVGLASAIRKCGRERGERRWNAF